MITNCKRSVAVMHNRSGWRIKGERGTGTEPETESGRILSGAEQIMTTGGAGLKGEESGPPPRWGGNGRMPTGCLRPSRAPEMCEAIWAANTLRRNLMGAAVTAPFTMTVTIALAPFRTRSMAQVCSRFRCRRPTSCATANAGAADGLRFTRGQAIPLRS